MPFFKTAYTGQTGSARSSGSQGEDIIHFNGVRIRVNGTGSLKLKLWSLDNARMQTLRDIQMAEDSGRIPTSLANFIEQRCALEGKTENIDDYFRINRIIMYSKWFASEFPM